MNTAAKPTGPIADLSPGTYYKRVPVDLERNLKFRRVLLASCRKHEQHRAVNAMCRDDLVFWINAFGWQFNPRRPGREVEPFILWPRQEEVLRETLRLQFAEQEDVLWEKSRELGATWLALFIDCWMALFHNHKKILLISHSEQAVDRGDNPDTLFWKLRFIHQHLPRWMNRSVRKVHLGLWYPATQSALVGTATSSRSGVSGRGPVTLDEFSKQTNDEEIYSQTRDTGPRLFIGTHYGVGTKFYALSRSVLTHKIVLHWSHHPMKRRGLYVSGHGRYEVLDESYDFPRDYPFVLDGRPHGGPFPGLRSVWYDKESAVRGPRDTAMHLDIDPQGSGFQVFDQDMIRRLQAQCCDPYHTGEISYDRDDGTPAKWISMSGGRFRIWTTLDHDGRPPKHNYGAAADVSVGNGTTNSCLVIADAETGDKVLEFTDPRIRPHDFAVLAVAACRWFANVSEEGAELVWENAGPGITFGQVVQDDLAYERLHWSRSELSQQATPALKIGWSPTQPGKLVLIRDYMNDLSAGTFTNRSYPALEDCLAMEYDPRGNIRHSAEETDDRFGARINHADLVITDALANRVIRGARDVYQTPQEDKPVQPGADSFLARRLLRQSRRQSDSWF